MKASLRIAAEFDPQVSAKFGNAGLSKATIIDDAANLMHTVTIEYAEKDEQLYRRLTYVLTAMQTMKEVLTVQNDVAEQLLYKISTALSGSTLGPGRLFEASMFQAGKDANGISLVWDDVLPTDKRKPSAKSKKED